MASKRDAMLTDLEKQTNSIYGSKALTLAEDGTLVSGPFVLTSVGLMMARAITFDEWSDFGKVLVRLSESVQWVVGDWLAYGEREWGQTYEDVATILERNIQTLYDYAWVARSVDFSLRQEKLSFEHHKIVAGLPPDKQSYWLQQAASGGWSTRRLQIEMKERPTPLKTSAAKFLRVSLEARKKYEKYVRKALVEGQGAKSQISQLIDQEIAELQKLRESLWDKNGAGGK